MEIMGDVFVTYEEAAARCGVSRYRVQRAVSEGRIATARPGRVKYLRLRDVDEWLVSLVTTVLPRRAPGRPRKCYP